MNKVTVNKEWCKQCGICIEFCPTNVFVAETDGTADPKYQEKCIACNICAQRCPDFAITVEVMEDAK